MNPLTGSNRNSRFQLLGSFGNVQLTPTAQFKHDRGKVGKVGKVAVHFSPRFLLHLFLDPYLVGVFLNMIETCRKFMEIPFLGWFCGRVVMPLAAIALKAKDMTHFSPWRGISGAKCQPNVFESEVCAIVSKKPVLWTHWHSLGSRRVQEVLLVDLGSNGGPAHKFRRRLCHRSFNGLKMCQAPPQCGQTGFIAKAHQPMMGINMYKLEAKTSRNKLQRSYTEILNWGGYTKTMKTRAFKGGAPGLESSDQQGQLNKDIIAMVKENLSSCR